MTVIHCFEYRIEPINGSSGIFFEHLGTAKIYAEEWKLITYLNITFYSTKLDLIKNIYAKSRILCVTNPAQIDVTTCQQTLEFLKLQIPIVEQKETTLFSLMNHKRTKRGIFNGGGSILKWILGIADADDLERIDDAINKVEKDDISVVNLMKEQIHVIKTTVGNFNDSIQSLKLHEKTLNSNIEQLNEFFKKDNTFKIKYVATVKLLSHLNTLTYLVNELSEQFDVLIDAVLFTKTNVIHPNILTPSQLIDELSSKLKYLENGKSFPLSLELGHAFKLLELSKLTCFYSNKRLIFIIEIPITEPTIINLYRSLPLPIITPRSTSSYAYFEPSFPFILLSTNKMQYIRLNNLDKCLKVTDEDLICEEHMIYSTLERPSCETSLLTSVTTSIPKSCKPVTLQGSVYIWHPLKFNQWIFVTTTEDRLTIICNESTTKDEVIQNIGILTLSKECTAYSKLNKLIPKNRITSEYHNVIPTARILDDDCCNEKSNETDSIVHLTNVHIANLRLDELRQATHQMNKFEEDLQQLNKKHQNNYLKTSYFYIIQVIAVIIRITILYKWSKWFGLFTLLPKACSGCGKASKGCCVSIFNQCGNTNSERT